MRTAIPGLLAIVLALASCSSGSTELFNGKNLDNWDIYVDKDEIAPEELFWVEDGVIHSAGVPHGYIRTKEVYENFNLQLEWRWVDEPTNSGVLLSVQGEDLIWPLCIECQLQAGNAGDIVLIGKGSGVTTSDSTYLVTTNEGSERYGVAKKMEDSSEHEAGQWNSYDITVVDGKLTSIVNGVLQNEASGMTLTSGNIALQSEGSPIQFRNIVLKPL